MQSTLTATVVALLPVIGAICAGCGRSGPPASGAVGDDDDGTATTSLPSPTPRPAIPGDLVINEIYFNLSGCTTPDCDANRSGGVDTSNDEFVEVVSVAAEPVFLDGIEVWEADQASPRFEFSAGVVLEPASAVVVFAGLDGTSPDLPAFGGALVFETGGGLDLSNGGDTLTLKDGIRVFGSAAWDGSTTANFSWVLDPEITGGSNYVTHAAHLDEDGAVLRNSSPGRRADFSPL